VGAENQGVATLFLMVGLPGAGKTKRAKELAAEQCALRLSPDAWMIPLFGESEAGGKRDVLEGRLIWVALEALKLSTSVVLDFGFWSRDERSALRWLATSAGASAQVIYLPLDRATQIGRIQHRWTHAPHETFKVTEADMDTWRTLSSSSSTSSGERSSISAANSGGTIAARRSPCSVR